MVAADFSEQDNQETARMIEELGRQALAIRCDVTRAEDVKAALDTTVETFGRLDTAFNNAGVEQATAATADISEEEWDRVVAINLRGVFLCMKYEIPLMRRDQVRGPRLRDIQHSHKRHLPGHHRHPDDRAGLR